MLDPKVLEEGVPDDAFTAVTGDDKEVAKAFKKCNRDERRGQPSLPFDVVEHVHDYATEYQKLTGIAEDTPAGVREKAKAYAAWRGRKDWWHDWTACNVWTAAFFVPLTKFDDPAVPTHERLLRFVQRQDRQPQMAAAANALSEQLHFFHWRLEFPEVFEHGGFDVVIGNPPWEAEELVEKEFFAVSAPEIASVRTKAKRSLLIAQLENDSPELFKAWRAEVRKFEARIKFARVSGNFPLGSSGKLNTYRLFAELAVGLVGPLGRSAQILKSGIVSAQEGQELFGSWMRDHRVVQVREFINTKLIFPDIVANERFCWLVLTGNKAESKSPTYAFGLETIQDARDPSRCFSASPEELAIINPADSSVPPLSSHPDFLLVLRIHRSAQPLRVDEQKFNPWNVHYTQGHLNSASDSSLFADNSLEQMEARGAVRDSREWFHVEGESFLPLYEGKYISQLNHRFSTFAGVPQSRRFGVKAEATKVSISQLQDPTFEIQPRYWLAATDATSCFSNKGTEHNWLFGFRDVCRAIVDARTVQACIMPQLPCLDGIPLLVFENSREEAAKTGLLFNSLWASFVFDYVARQKIHGAHLTKAIAYQLPVPSTVSLDRTVLGESFREFLSKRSLELTAVSNSLLSFIADAGADGPPFRWDVERRFLLRCESDAAYFHLYLAADKNGSWRNLEGESAQCVAQLKAYFPTPRAAVLHIMDSFTVLRRREAEQYGEYKSKRVIMEIYDRMQRAIETGQMYQTVLDPPPADPRCRHPKQKIGILAFGSLISDPGHELRSKIAMRIKTKTPFGVEYGRYSGKTRGGAPTLVPHPGGCPVSAEIFVLEDDVTTTEATNMLWRRETRKTGTDATYVEGTSENSVLVRNISDNPWVETLLYTDFTAAGKIQNPDPAELAERAIRSVETAEPGMDGISYLIAAIGHSIQTSLTAAYLDEILRRTKTDCLSKALLAIKSAQFQHSSVAQD